MSLWTLPLFALNVVIIVVLAIVAFRILTWIFTGGFLRWLKQERGTEGATWRI